MSFPLSLRTQFLNDNQIKDEMDVVRQLLLIPVFSTWSMHILTKFGTDVFSPLAQAGQTAAKHLICGLAKTHCWSKITIFKQGHVFTCVWILSGYLWCILCPWRPDMWGVAWGNFLSFNLVFFWSDESMLTEVFITEGTHRGYEREFFQILTVNKVMLEWDIHITLFSFLNLNDLWPHSIIAP